MPPRFRSVLALTPLESRLAPAALATLTIAADGHSAIYTDVDGDRVTVKTTGFPVSGGLFTSGLFEGVAVTAGHEQLQKLNLSGGGFDHANLTFTVAKVPDGDGLVNVGYIDSTNHDLGTVSVKGDLGQIDAGDAATLTPGLKALSVRSLGRLGTDTQAGVGSLQSDIKGALGSLNVAADVVGAFVQTIGGAAGTIGAVTIGGSLIGGSTADAGEILSTGDMGNVKIGRDVQGAAGAGSGWIKSLGKLGTVTIGGSLIGGANTDTGKISSTSDMGWLKIGRDVRGGGGSTSGFIRCDGAMVGVNIGGSLIGGLTTLNPDTGHIYCVGDLGPVKIGRDVRGGYGAYSGIVQSRSKLASVTIGGSLVAGVNDDSGDIFSIGDMGPVKIGGDVQGGPGRYSGEIESHGILASLTIGGSLIGGLNYASGIVYSVGDMGPVKIGRDLVGGSITGNASVDDSGVIESAGQILSVSIGGSIIAGSDSSNGTLTRNATIRAAKDIVALTVKGSLIGRADAGFGSSPVIISASGQATPGATTDVAIGKLTIGGRVENANILAGYDRDLNPVNGNAQIGAVSVTGDWVASSLVAGVMNSASGNLSFGDANDAVIAGSSAGIIAKIASITIKGQVFGTSDSVSAADHYGFVAQQIGALKFGGKAIALVPNASNDNLGVGETSDVNLHEVA